MDTFSFREATITDAAAVAGLHIESWRNAYRGILPDAFLDGPIFRERETVWQERLSPPGLDRRLVVLALNDEEPIGFACVLPDEEPVRGACLDNLHVLPRWRGQGVGRQLFARAAQWSSQVTPDRPMHLWLFEENHPARRFYDSLKGRVVDRRFKRIGGTDVPSLCYVWDDLDALVRRAIGSSK
jgi:GNAT superfamily N-acetyltransferase